MAAGDILTVLDAEAAFTISIASLANGSARASDSIDNTTDQRPAALINLGIQSGGTAPTDGNVYDIYLLRRDTTATIIGTDGWNGTDSAITIVNAPLLGTIVVTNDANTVFFGEFDTRPLGPLGPTWGIAIHNRSGQALNASGHTTRHTTYRPQVQQS